MSEARRLGRILTACVTEHDWDEPPPGLAPLVEGQDLRPLLRRAAYHGVDNFVFVSLRALQAGGTEVDPAVIAELAHRYDTAVRHHLSVLADLAFLTASLQALEVPYIVFKGPVLSATLYPRVDLRSYRDVDLLVPQASFAQVVSALEEAGWPVLDRNWELLRRLELGQVHLPLRHGTLADLHWHLANGKAIRASLSIPMDDLFARARPVSLSGIDLVTFGPVDTVLHLCVHAALAGGTRLLWLKDLERAVSVEGPSWNEIVEGAQAWGAALLVGTVLQRASRAVGAPVPADVISALVPARWARSANAGLDLMWPPEAAFGRLGPSGIWLKYRRDRAFSTALLLVGRQWARWRARGHRRTPVGGGPDWSDVMPAFRPGGGLDARKAFFDAVSGSPESGTGAEPPSCGEGRKT